MIFEAASSGIPELPGLWSLTPWGALLGLIVLFALLVLTGRFIPKSSHERELAVANKRGDDWKAAYDEQSKVVVTQGGQINALMEVGHVVEAVLRASAPPFDETTAPSRGG